MRLRYHSDSEHRDVLKMRARKYRASVPKKEMRKRARASALKGYGISIEIYNETLARQGGGCAICSSKTRRFHVDHDHSTDKVRGILCDACNKALGVFGDSLAGVMRVVKYLRA